MGNRQDKRLEHLDGCFLVGEIMAKEYAKKFYKSTAWQKCRESYISKAFGLCEHCGGPGYIVDHIVEITPDNINDPDVTLNHDNLQFLCTPCHNKKTFKRLDPVRDDVMFDSNGQLIKKELTGRGDTPP